MLLLSKSRKRRLRTGIFTNRQVMEAHRYSMKSETISSLRVVKDHMHRIGGVLKFEVTKDVLKLVACSQRKYHVE